MTYLIHAQRHSLEHHDSRVIIIAQSKTKKNQTALPVPMITPSIRTSTPPTPTTNTLHLLILLELRAGHATNTRGIEIRLLGLDAA